jgi:hypothetical protein
MDGAPPADVAALSVVCELNGGDRWIVLATS